MYSSRSQYTTIEDAQQAPNYTKLVAAGVSVGVVAAVALSGTMAVSNTANYAVAPATRVATPTAAPASAVFSRGAAAAGAPYNVQPAGVVNAAQTGPTGYYAETSAPVCLVLLCAGVNSVPSVVSPSIVFVGAVPSSCRCCVHRAAQPVSALCWPSPWPPLLVTLSARPTRRRRPLLPWQPTLGYALASTCGDPTPR